MEPVTLTTARLVIRPFEAADIDATVAACQDPEIPLWTPVPSPYGREHAKRFIESTCPAGWRENAAYTFAAVTKGTGALVGAVGLHRRAPGNTPDRQVELGYWTAKEHRGAGLTTEAARAVVRWAFTDLGVERVEWLAQAGHEASRSVALKVGFRMEGTLRAKIVHRGARHDAWVGSLLPSDLGLPSATPHLPFPR